MLVANVSTTNREAVLTGRGLSRTVLIIVNTVVLAPIPNASIRMINAANAGLWRRAHRVSHRLLPAALDRGGQLG